MDIWFDFNVGRIETDDDGTSRYYRDAGGEYRVTLTSNPVDKESVRSELHRMLDTAIDAHVKP